MPAYINNRFLNDDEATLHVSDLSIQRGYAVFDFFRTLNGIPLFQEDHLDRFWSSASAFHLPVTKSRDEIRTIIQELISRSGIPEAGIRIMLTGGYASDTYRPVEPNLVMTCKPVKTAMKEDFEKGVAAITYEYQRELPHIKSIAYQHAVWLQPWLKEKKADDVVYYKDNLVTEFPRSNIFIVTAEGILATPVHNILSGITRKQVLSLAEDMMPVETRDITVDELLNAAEIFLTSTSRRILPVVKMNEKIISGAKPGKITRSLYQRFLELERNTVHLVSR